MFGAIYISYWILKPFLPLLSEASILSPEAINLKY